MQLKIFFIYAQIILHAKDLLIFIDRYSPAHMKALLHKLYKVLPEKPCEEEEFVSRFTTWFKLLEVIVDCLWYFCRDFMHRLTWKYLEVYRAAWEWFFDLLKQYAQETQEALRDKMDFYKQVYNTRVAPNLIEQDIETDLEVFDFWFKIRTLQAIEEAKEEHVEPPPEGGNWLYYVDATGKLYVNPNWDPNK